ncbi:MAG: hypothetical protein ACLGIR_11925 [Actinomycetes bacterium]
MSDVERTIETEAGTEHAASPQLRVVGGGAPTPEELAALIVALTPAGGGADAAVPVAAAWSRAALLEGVGARPMVSAAEIDRADHAHPARPRG